jgi:hypothetical protein
MKLLAKWITEAAENIGKTEALQKIGAEVRAVAEKFPVPGINI